MGSIGDFAESLIVKELKSNPKSSKNHSSFSRKEPAPPDISKVNVPSGLRNKIIQESFYSQDQPSAKGFPKLNWNYEEPKQEVQDSSLLTEGTAKKMIPLLEQLTELLSELTSCGTIGVNFSPKQKLKNSLNKRKLKK